jgi:hypothetical protein
VLRGSQSIGQPDAGTEDHNDGAKQRRQDEVDRRTGERDEQLGPPCRNVFQPRDAADGVEHDLSRPHTHPSGHRGVSQLVEHDADEEQDQEQYGQDQIVADCRAVIPVPDQ